MHDFPPNCHKYTVQDGKTYYLSVALLVADSIVEDVPAVPAGGRGCVAHLPWVDSQTAVSPVVVAEVVVAFLVAPVVAGLGGAPQGLALDLLLVDVQQLVLAVLPVDPARRSLVPDVALLASPLFLADAVKVPDLVDALAVVAGVVLALVPRVQLALVAFGAGGAVAFEGQVPGAGKVVLAGSTVVARVAVTN